MDQRENRNDPAVFAQGAVRICLGDAMDWYERWDAPTVIVSDGPYGLGQFPGEAPTTAGLADWYEPHLKAWYAFALPSATLWFWNSEQGWATCHNQIEASGWEFRNCHIWDKGIGHIAGNCNTQTIRKFPVITEVCVQYVRRNRLPSVGREMDLREWLRSEWQRSGLPLNLSNEACGVRNAATRKYFTSDHLWYFPPPEAFQAIVDYVNRHGKPDGRPYFSRDGKRPMTGDEWATMRAKFSCEIGISNVWHAPAVRGHERLRDDGVCLHMNQKPLKLVELCIAASSDSGDVVWEPFGGLCTAAVAAAVHGRRAFAAEINPSFFLNACERLARYDDSEILFRGDKRKPTRTDASRTIAELALA
jgi:site-specific DNA-methyltransferase (adenine-specific)